MKTAVVILNYNTRDYLRKFLPALIASCQGLDAGVIVADNASTDGSAELMQKLFPDIPLILLEKNFGFTGGYNRALQEIEAEYFVLINSDIEVPSGWLQPLVQWMDSHPDCGACGPKLLSYKDRDSFEYAGAAGGCLDRYGYPFCRGRALQTVEKDRGQYNLPADVLWVSGACLLVRSSLWKALGGLDERFFAHMEEIDLCWRMQLRGWKVTVVPQSWVYHIGGGTLPNNSPFKLRLNYRNNLLLLENNLAATFKAEGLGPDKRCYAKARRRILFRMLLDGASALVYLVSGKWSYFQAVIHAHQEYRKLRTTPDLSAQGPATVQGLDPRMLLLQFFMGKNRIFAGYKCKVYEDHH